MSGADEDELACKLMNDSGITYTAAREQAKQILKGKPPSTTPRVLTPLEREILLDAYEQFLEAREVMQRLVLYSRPPTWEGVSTEERKALAARLSHEVPRLLLTHPKLPLTPLAPLAALMGCTTAQLSYALRDVPGVVQASNGKWHRKES